MGETLLPSILRGWRGGLIITAVVGVVMMNCVGRLSRDKCQRHFCPVSLWRVEHFDIRAAIQRHCRISPLTCSNLWPMGFCGSPHFSCPVGN
jgi:hypothetical protein